MYLLQYIPVAYQKKSLTLAASKEEEEAKQARLSALALLQ